MAVYPNESDDKVYPQNKLKAKKKKKKAPMMGARGMMMAKNMQKLA